MELEPIIGLEVHVQLKTRSKMFCRCDNRDDQPPNTAICPICTAQPGALPLPNQQAIDWAVMTGLALGCSINQHSKFDRKHYFYPDLPKGYQISQYDVPFGYAGSVRLHVGGQAKTFRIHRLHLEEDAGKLIHPDHQPYSLVDLNRAGTPLMEIVSEPDFRTAQEAKAYLQELRLVMRYVGVSDADMEKGHLRCDANISLRPKGEDRLYPKTEIKNLNSFKAVEKALEYEIKRQTGLWEDGQAPKQPSTRGWDEASGTTKEQRTKEAAADYRYFPEPDIPPVIFSDEQLARLQGLIPELPAARRERFTAMYGLSSDLAEGLVGDPGLAKYFEEIISEVRAYAVSERGAEGETAWWNQEKTAVVQLVANWLLNRVPVEHRTEHGLPPPTDLARLLWMVQQSTVSLQAAMKVYEAMLKTKRGPHALVQELGLEQISDMHAIAEAARNAIAANQKVVAEIRAGKQAGIQFLVGQVMKATKGQANPQVAQAELKKALGL